MGAEYDVNLRRMAQVKVAMPNQLTGVCEKGRLFREQAPEIDIVITTALIGRLLQNYGQQKW